MSIVFVRIARLWGALTGRYRGRALLAFAVACLAAPGVLYLVPGTVAFHASVCATSLFWESPEPARLLARVRLNEMTVSSGEQAWEFPASAGPYQLSEIHAEVPFAARVHYWPAAPVVAQPNGLLTRGNLELKLLSRATAPAAAGAPGRSTFSAVLYRQSSRQAPWIYRQNGHEVQSQDIQVRFEEQASRFDVVLGFAADESPSEAFALDPLVESVQSGAAGLRVEPGSLSFSESESGAAGRPTAPRSTVRVASVNLVRIGDQSVADGQSLSVGPPGFARIERLRLDSSRGCIEAVASGRTQRLCIDEEDCTEVSRLEGWMGKERAWELVQTTTLATIVLLLGAIVRAGVLGRGAS